MKKVVIVLAMLALVAMPAFAVTPSVKMYGNTTITNGNFPATGANAMDISVAGSETGWSAEAALGTADALKLGAYKVAFTDPLFNITIWGKGKEVADMKDPFSFVTSAKKHSGNMKVRAVAGPLTVDYEDSGKLYAFGSKAIAGHKLGIAAKSDLPLATDVTVVGHDVTNVAGVELTGAVGARFQKGQEFAPENLAFGIKASAAVPMLPSVKATASYKSQPAGFNGVDQDQLFVEGVQELEQTRLVGSLTHNIKTSDRSKTVSDVIAATAYWRGSKDNQKWDDQFKADKYFKNVAPAVKANVSRTTAPDVEPVTVVTLNGTMPVMPQLWANGSIKNELEAKKTTIVADAYYKALPKLAIEPGATVTLEQGQDNKVDLRTKATYQMTSNGKMTAGYSMNTVAGEKTGDKVDFGYEVKF